MPYFSVIIPVYNSKKYLPDAVHSILNQPLQDFEIIIIDDGSNDGTEVICDELADQYSCICVIRQTNQGVSAARNTGIRKAQGTYIMFLDADDCYVTGAINQEMLLECNKGYGVIMYSSLSANVKRNRYYIDMKMGEAVIRGGQALPISGHFGSCLYRRDVLLERNVYFDEGIRLNEDEAFKMKAMYAADFIRMKEGFLYIYNTTPNSARYIEKNIYDYIEAWKKVNAWLIQDGERGNRQQAESYVRQKILSRMLLYAKLYVQQGHGKRDLLYELERIKALEPLKNISVGYMIPSQRKELIMFQEHIDQFMKYARLEGHKIRIGRMLLKIPFIRGIRDRKKFPWTDVKEVTVEKRSKALLK
mgnify:FL=1